MQGWQFSDSGAALGYKIRTPPGTQLSESHLIVAQTACWLVLTALLSWENESMGPCLKQFGNVPNLLYYLVLHILTGPRNPAASMCGEVAVLSLILPCNWLSHVKALCSMTRGQGLRELACVSAWGVSLVSGRTTGLVLSSFLMVQNTSLWVSSRRFAFHGVAFQKDTTLRQNKQNFVPLNFVCYYFKKPPALNYFRPAFS